MTEEQSGSLESSPLPAPGEIAPTENALEMEASPQPPARAFSLRDVFIGPEGLRAGWSLCVYIVFMAAMLALITVVVRHSHLFPPPPPKGSVAVMKPGLTIINEAVPFAVTLMVAWVMSRIEKRPNGVYGMGGTRRARNFFVGLLWGIGCLTALVSALVLTGHLVFDGRLLFGSQVAKYAAVWGVGFLLVGLLEEYLVRGYLQFTLARGLAGIYGAVFKTRHRYALGFWTAAVLLSFLFGAGHGKNPGESPIGDLSAGLAGFVFAYSLWRTGSLWWAIGFHAAWDWGQSYLYGVADSGLTTQGRLYATHAAGKALLSGGTTGPEGSIFVLPTLALVALIIWLTLRQAQQPVPGAGLQPPV